MSKVKVSLDGGVTFQEVDKVIVEPISNPLEDDGSEPPATLTADHDGVLVEVWAPTEDQELLSARQVLWGDIPSVFSE